MTKGNSKERRLGREDFLPEYDFRGAIRGKHYKAYRKGYTVKILKSDGTVIVKRFKPVEGAVALEPEVRAYFPDSKAVNKALRSLIALTPKKRRAPAKVE